MGGPATEDLLERHRALRAQLTRQEATIHRLRQREMGYQELLTHSPDLLAEISFRNGAPYVRPLSVPPNVKLDLGVLLSTERAREKQQQALKTGGPIVYDTSAPQAEGRKHWRVRLMAISEADEDPLLLAIVRRAATLRRDGRWLENEEVYLKVIELLPDAVTIVDAASRLCFANTAATRLLGAAHTEAFLDTSFWRFIPTSERAAMEKRMHRLRQGETVEFIEHRIRQLDGEEVPVETASTPISYRGRPAVLNAVRDLRPRKRMEAAVAGHRERFYKAFRLGPAALSITRLSDGVFVDANEQFLHLSGYAREELVSHSMFELNVWMDPEVWAAMLARMAREDVVRDIELRLRREDGSRRTVIASCRRIEMEEETCLLTSIVDVTARKRAEAAERESRELFRRIFHASPTPISISHLEGGRIVDVNDAFCRLTGYTREELLNRTSREPDLWVRSERRGELLEALRERDPIQDFEMEIRTRYGEIRELLSSFQVITVEGETCLLGVETDITVRKHAEEELRRAKEHAEEVARFRTGILTNMTHEVRTPLTVILGFTSMLREGVRKEYERFVDLIERSGRRLLLTLDSVLDLAQLEAGTLQVKAQPYNVVEVIQRALEPLKPMARERGLSLVLQTPEPYIYARIDHDLLARVLNHLIDNAVKFTEEGTVTIDVYFEDAHVCVAVRDTGIGIEEEFLPHLFDPFAQESTGLDRTYQGSGLGLTVARQLVERLGGTIEVESEKGQGSVFTVVLPKAEMSVPA